MVRHIALLRVRLVLEELLGAGVVRPCWRMRGSTSKVASVSNGGITILRSELQAAAAAGPRGVPRTKPRVVNGRIHPGLNREATVRYP